VRGRRKQREQNEEPLVTLSHGLRILPLALFPIAYSE
jgi:hypothetical protein